MSTFVHSRLACLRAVFALYPAAITARVPLPSIKYSAMKRSTSGRLAGAARSGAVIFRAAGWQDRLPTWHHRP